MLKKILTILLALLMCLSLAACGGDTASGNDNTAKEGNTQGTEDTSASDTDSETDQALSYEPERFETDTLTWKFDANTGTLAIHGEGPMRSYLKEAPEWDQHREEILSITMDDGITSIGEYAFADCSKLTSVQIPDAVEVIDTGAFDYDIELRTITIPASLKYVGYRAFYNTLLWEPEDLVFPEGCEYIGDYAFHSALKSGGKVSLPASLKYLGVQSFTNAYLSDFVIADGNESYCVDDHTIYTKDMKEIRMMAPYTEESPKEFRIPDGVERIPAECFNLIQGIKKIYIPASVTEIEEGAFFSTFDLKEILVDEGNPNYKSEKGLLLSKDGKLLLASPDGRTEKELVIPDGVERIGGYLFYGRCEGGYKVVIPEGVKEIGTMSLPNDMASLTLPAGLEKIDDYVFYDGITVGQITYNGSKADWEKITIEDGNTGLDTGAVQMK